jgi:sterol 3beta-glucosyltransferase
MKVTILTLGTRGDVQPYVALALALKRIGYTPRIAAPLNFEKFIRKNDVGYAPIQMDTEEGLKSREGREWLASGNTRAFIRRLNILMERDRPALHAGCWEACQDADAIVATMMTLGEGITLSEKLRRPLLASILFPVLPRSRCFPQFLVAAKDLPTGWLNYLTHILFERVTFSSMREDLNRWRAQLSLAPLNEPPSTWLRRHETLTLHHYGEPLFQTPRDWKPNNVLTGPMFLPGAEPFPPALDAFLAAGESPVCLGFGSMPVLDPTRVLQTAARVTEKLGVRAVVVAGWSQVSSSVQSKNLIVVESADYFQLFPRCQALVHHGGTGTSFIGVSCKRPALVFSVFADQPFWGERLKKAGVGAHYRFREFSEDALLSGLRQVLQPAIKERAQHLGDQVDREAGTIGSAARIAAYLQTSSAPTRGL